MFTPTPIAGLQVFTPRIFGDERGYFFESWNEQTFAAAGIDTRFVQDNQARSSRGVLRGLHFQTGEHAQAKLVRVIEGEVFDVAVDMRPGSPTLHEWFGIRLSGENQKQLFVPRGFAHGYLVLSESAVFAYKCDNFYAKHAEGGVRYDDPAIGIEWPKVDAELVVAERDLTWDSIAR
ncbi:dTDP-4-dehydrorhamnose 3,5-epimerase [Neolewinella aurantiaca]|uniref:dTDP-4-dehydrorhamnose 3,5-epimerase n=1 Tax=Neolewinella aurantiaca TaxID=2602767 RepID=A0A5C7FTL4_9BACT|nr:dTDP-4-dehydrorhamnose 3,5-epimerase [Neolewinella aurantiaca]TXF88166.1 dTDP-4-dehydrorhamnose 3,5-epimerase [Neolewinella aurantiaca]